MAAMRERTDKEKRPLCIVDGEGNHIPIAEYEASAHFFVHQEPCSQWALSHKGTGALMASFYDRRLALGAMKSLELLPDADLDNRTTIEAIVGDEALAKAARAILHYWCKGANDGDT